jgi:menaquinone-dependent protoporphyrinogen oxidase
MPSVLVAYATRSGGTRDIATVIGEQLTAAGMQVTVSDVGQVRTFDGYDAAVVGSAVYTGRWRADAVELLARQADDGRPIPAWLFQSGPCGEAAADPVPAPKRVRLLADRLGTAAPTTFGGRLEPATARGFLARRLAAGPLAGDFRDFPRVRRWADAIATELLTSQPTATGEPGRAGDR